MPVETLNFSRSLMCLLNIRLWEFPIEELYKSYLSRGKHNLSLWFFPIDETGEEGKRKMFWQDAANVSTF